LMIVVAIASAEAIAIPAPCLAMRSPPRLAVTAPCSAMRSPLVTMSAAPDPVDRAVSAVVYILPVLDGFVYGSNVFASVPAVGRVAYNFVPVVNAFQSLPFAGLILFIGLSTFTRNTGLSRYVRFNIQQALLVDIALIIPGAFGGATRIFPVELQAFGSNFVFYAMCLIVGYSWVSIAQAQTPDRVPIISEAAAIQIGPF